MGQIFRSAEAGYNATLVPTVLGLGAPRRTHVGAVPYRTRWSWVGSLRRYAKGKSHWNFVDGPRQTTAVSKAAGDLYRGGALANERDRHRVERGRWNATQRAAWKALRKAEEGS